MRISFKLVNEQKVLIMGGDKEIGHIFSPASSGNDLSNCVQVCGFEEAFDLWGCGIYGEDKTVRKVLTDSDKSKMSEQVFSIKKLLQENPNGHDDIKKIWNDRIQGLIDAANKGYVESEETIMKKDIQLLFSDYKKVNNKNHCNGCSACFNNPCTCENKGNHLMLCPFEVKREHNLKEQIEFKTNRSKVFHDINVEKL